VSAAAADLKARLQGRQQQVDARLHELLPAPTAQPPSIHQAMRHSVFAGGKRVRPVLCLEAAAAVNSAGPEPIDVACALECIHTYSLIHDDLPALDNDDFRRGHPTCHKAFGEATAILAGDALLTLAFQILARTGHAKIVEEIAAAAGTVNGMIGGQVVDIESERKVVDAATLEYIHRSKTGALLRASVRSGALAAGATGATLELFTEFGRQVGLLFQIVDDILDVEGSTEELGKTAGKDAKQQKATYPGVHGLAKAHQMAEQTLAGCLKTLEPLGESGRWLRELALYIGRRKA
jgi:geranylgeranyl diphosphate synthase type II